MFVLSVTLMAASGNQTTMLNAGPLPAAQVVLPVGEFALYAEVYDEANAYGVYQVKMVFGIFSDDNVKMWNVLIAYSQSFSYLHRTFGNKMLILEELL